MRDLVAAGLALVLVFFALSLLTTLTVYRRRLRQRREREEDLGRAIIAEVPTESELVLVTEDGGRFHYGGRSIVKDRIAAVRVLVNGAPIASYVSSRWPEAGAPQPTTFEDHPEGIARDRWDVAIESVDGTLLVECGAIRERISQELARRIYDRVKADLVERDAATTPPRSSPRGD